MFSKMDPHPGSAALRGQAPRTGFGFPAHLRASRYGYAPDFPVLLSPTRTIT